MKKPYFLLLAALGLFSSSAFAQDIWKPGYVFDSAANTGVDVWYGPGNKVTMNGAFARGANVAASSGAFEIAETGSVLLRDGRAVALTATRVASAGALAMAAAKLASGPVGIVAVLALPAVYDWITADNATKIRVNPTRTGVELFGADPTSAVTVTCQAGTVTGSLSSVGNQCKSALETYWRSQGYGGCSYALQLNYPDSFYLGWNGVQCGGYPSFTTSTPSAKWAPSTLDDISPYLSARLPAESYPKQIIDAGGEIDVTPKSITGPSPALVPPAPHVVTTQYPSPADQVSTSQAAGNPFGLPANTPTQTGSSTGSASVSPGSSSTSGGPLPSGSASPVPQPISSPTTTTNISNYNPTTNVTTTTSTTHVDPQTQVTTVTNVTNITNTTNTSTVTNSTTTVTNTTNNTTNQTVTKTDSTPVKANPPAPAPAPVCGVSGLPACTVKVDETGMPAPVVETVYNSKLDPVKTAAETARQTMSGSADKPFFSGWSVLFSAPAVAACAPIVLPGFQGGASMGSIDPCPVVEGVRYVMGLIWAMVGMLFSLKMIKEVV